MRNPNYIQQNWLFRNDDGSLSTATNISAGGEDSAVVAGDEIFPGTKFRIRFNFGEENNADSANTGTGHVLQYDLDGAANWTTVPTTAGADGIAMASSDQGLTDGDPDTTQRLTAITGTTFTGSWTEFDDNNALTDRTWTDQSCEFEFCVELSSGTENNVYEFRMLAPDGGVPDSEPASYASLTVADPNVTELPLLVELDLGVTGSEPTIIHNRVAAPKTVPLNIWKSIGLKLDGQPLSIDVSAGGDQTRTPDTDALTIDEKTPVTVVANVREPAIDELVLGEQTPITVVNHVTKPLLRSLDIAEQTPTAPIANVREPAIDELVLGVVGSEPTVSVGIVRIPAIDELVLGVAGSEPTVIHDRVAAPDKDDLVIDEKTPIRSVSQIALPDKDELVLGVVGSEPTVIVDEVENPLVGSLSLGVVGSEPTVIHDRVAAPDNDALDIDEQTPIRFVGETALPAIDELVLGVAGNEPASVVNHIAIPDTYALDIAEKTPIRAVSRIALPGIDELALGVTGSEPTVVVSHVAVPDKDTLVIDEQTPTVPGAGVALPTTRALALGVVGSEPTVVHDRVAIPNKDDLVIDEKTPVRTVSRIALPTEDELVLGVAGNEPSSVIANNREPSTDSLALGVVGNDPEAVVSHVSAPGTDDLVIDEKEPTASGPGVVQPTKRAVTLTGKNPRTDIGPKLIQVPSGAINIWKYVGLKLDGDPPNTIINGVFPTEDTLVLGGKAPTAVVGGGSASIEIPSGAINLWKYIGLKLDGNPPSLVTSHVAIPGKDSLILDEQTPTRVVNRVVTPDAGSIAIDEKTPIRAVSRVAAPATGELNLLGLGYLTSDIPTGTLTIAEQSVSLKGLTKPTTGSLVISSDAPTAALDAATPSTVGLSITGQQPTASIPGGFEPDTVSVTLDGQPVSIFYRTGTFIENPNATTSVPTNYEVCDYTGFKQMPGSLKLTWNKYAVRRKSYEERHPQERMRNTAPRRKGSRRPEKEDTFIDDLYPNGVDPDDL